MTTQFSAPTQSPRTGTAAAAAIAVIATVAVFFLFTAGVTFAALAYAFPLIAPFVDQFPTISASDVVLAAQFADAWWVFTILAVASLAAAVVVAVKAIQHLSPTSRD
ncbi:MAG: hypothetical protein QOF49_765 [Chloroflexota bacterium]|nr:hypothetical protein [Chloroflexota bacterium]